MWAGWRLAALKGEGDQRAYERRPGQSVFEALIESDLDDSVSYILARTPRCFAILNLFPYTSGHVLVLPNRAVESLTALTTEEHDELWRLVRDSVAAIESGMRPHGINVGLNQGEAAGGSIVDHLHVHCMPRWASDTNFMTTVANARVLPETLDESWSTLRAHWPD